MQDKKYYQWLDYDIACDKIELYREIKKIIYTRFKKPLIFDLGCGTGYLTSYLGAVGFDINNYAIERARQKYPHTRFYRANVNKIKLDSFKLRKAHALLCLNLIEHMSDRDRLFFFKKTIPNILVKQGILVFSLHQQYYLLSIINMLLRRGFIFDPTHVHNWTTTEFVREVGKFLKILKVKNLASFTRLTNLTKYFKNETLIVAKVK